MLYSYGYSVQNSLDTFNWSCGPWTVGRGPSDNLSYQYNSRRLHLQTARLDFLKRPYTQVVIILFWYEYKNLSNCFLFWCQYRAFFIIYNLTNDCTVIVITNNMLLHVSTFKMSSSGSLLCLAKITYRFSGLSKLKLLKYKTINFYKMLIVQRNKRFA